MDSKCGRFSKSLSSRRCKQSDGTNSLPRLKNPSLDISEEHDSSFDIFVNDGTKRSDENNTPVFDLSPYSCLECCPVCLKSCGPMEQHLELCGPKNGVVGERLVILCQLHQVYLEKRKLMNFPVNFHEIQYQNFEKIKKIAPPKIVKTVHSKKKAPLFVSSQDMKDNLVQQKIELIVADMPEYECFQNEEKSLLDVMKIPLWYIAGTDLATLVNYYVPHLAPHITNHIVSDSPLSEELLEKEQSQVDLDCDYLGLDNAGEDKNMLDEECLESIEKKRKLSSSLEQVEADLNPKRLKSCDSSSEALVCYPVKTAPGTISYDNNFSCDQVMEEDMFEEPGDVHINKPLQDKVMESMNETFCKEPEPPVNPITENKNLETLPDQCDDSNEKEVSHVSTCQSSVDVFDEENSKEPTINRLPPMNSDTILIESSDEEVDGHNSDATVNPLLKCGSLVSSTPSDSKKAHSCGSATSDTQEKSEDSFWMRYLQECPQNDLDPLNGEDKENYDWAGEGVNGSPIPLSECSDDNNTTLEFVSSDGSSSSSEEPLEEEVPTNSQSYYENMNEDQLKEELSKYGLKRNLGRRKGIMLLNHIRVQLNKIHSVEPDNCDSANGVSTKTNECHDKSITELCGEQLFQGGQFDVLSKFIKGNAELHSSLLKFKPVWLDEFQVLLKDNNISISKAKLKKYSDNLGIIYREKQKV